MLLQGVLTVMALAPPPTAGADFNPQSAEVTVSGQDVQVVARDSTGETVAVLALWPEEDGVHVSADYGGDAWSEAVVFDGKVQIETGSGITTAELEHRAAMIEGLLYDVSPPVARGWFGCGAGVVGTAIGCATANPWGCVVGGMLMACQCIPLAIKEFKDIECP